jgi:mannitol-1-phosphate 5-dehydrogenase
MISKTAVQFGAGNIGRGFIGGVLSEAGYKVIFADVVEDLINKINERKSYTIHVTDYTPRDIEISGVSAVNSGSPEAVEAVAGADIVTTAVGLRILKFVAPAIAKGISKRRIEGNETPLNVIACENGLGATAILKDLVFEKLSAEEKAWTEAHVGFVSDAVDRIVPPVHCEIPLDVAVEEYYEWDTQKDQFAGPVPQIGAMHAVDNLEAYIERKLFTLNTGHAATAYLGKLKGCKTIGEALKDKEIYAVVRGIMEQSGEGLIKKFGFDPKVHEAYIEKVLSRFQNPYLSDDVNRVGREPLRKLSANDRLVFPMMTARNYGLPYDKFVTAIAAALRFDNPEDPQSVQMLADIKDLGIEAAIEKFTGIKAGDSLCKEIAAEYQRLGR